jgi:hypothetical protein
MKTVLVFTPVNYPTISRRFFKSFLEVTGTDVREELARKDIRVITYIHDNFDSLAYAQNDGVERALNELHADYMLFLDSDMTFPRRIIPMLLENISEKYLIACGLYFRKPAPHACVVGRYNRIRNNYQKTAEAIGAVDSEGRQLISYDPIGKFDPNGGPFEVDVFGKGCTMVHLDAFRKLQQPYFEHIDGYEIGDHTIRSIQDDMILFSKWAKAGIKGVCDPRVLCSHLREVPITNEDFDKVVEDQAKLGVKVEGFIDVRSEQKPKVTVFDHPLVHEIETRGAGEPRIEIRQESVMEVL